LFWLADLPFFLLLPILASDLSVLNSRADVPTRIGQKRSYS